MSKQAIQLAALFKDLPLAEKLMLLEMMPREVKEQALKRNGTAAKKRKAGYSKAVFEMPDDFNPPL